MNNDMIRFYDLHPPIADFKQEVLTGLQTQPKALSPKFFYDKKGSVLFDKITELPEYYPTRAELDILQTHCDEMADLLGDDCLLVELGSGSSQKIRTLLQTVKPAAYMPMDISKQHLLDAAQTLSQDYPELEIHATCADYSSDFDLPYRPEHLSRAAFFPGSSIGNFDPQHAQALLERVANSLEKEGKLLVGVDLKKESDVLNAAYNDKQGVTAAFNLNLLDRINRELDGNFDLANFYHHAFYNETQGRVEMHLVSLAQQQVSVGKQDFEFSAGESIHTESSYKYSVSQFHQLAAKAGFKPVKSWTDEQHLFSVHCLQVK
jgi:dimethylhistidine N-methyltransferase